MVPSASAHHVEVTGMAGVLPQHVEQDPDQGRMLVGRVEAPAAPGHFLKPCRSDDLPGPGALGLEQGLEVLGRLPGANLPQPVKPEGRPRLLQRGEVVSVELGPQGLGQLGAGHALRRLDAPRFSGLRAGCAHQCTQ